MTRSDSRTRAGNDVPILFVTAASGLEERLGTVVWPNGLDLDPLVLHGDFEPAKSERAGRSSTSSHAE